MKKELKGEVPLKLMITLVTLAKIHSSLTNKAWDAMIFVCRVTIKMKKQL